jgi:non-ribosomal peptide synthetase component F
MVSLLEADAATQLKIVAFRLIERNNIPLLVVVEPGPEFHFRVVYMGSRFDDATIDQMLENFKQILRQLTSNPDAPVASISHHGDDERQSLIDSFNQSLASL